MVPFWRNNPGTAVFNDKKGALENIIFKDTPSTHTKADIKRADALVCENKLDKAYKIYKDILGENSKQADALLGIGIILKKQQKFDLAIQFLSKAVEANPAKIQALLTRGRILRLQGMSANAISDFTKIISNHPDNFEALIARGITHGQACQFNMAIDDFNMAIKINADSGEAFYNRGVAYEKMHEFDAAIEDYSFAIKLNPHDYKAYNNRGVARRETKCFDAAIKDFDKCVEINPDFAEGYYNKSLTLLSVGRLREGFKLYEYRWKTNYFQSQVRHFSQPLWLGKESLTGKTILVHSEQGFGDSIQFCRYIKFFETIKCRVLLEIEKPLMSLMQSLLPGESIFEKGSHLPAFDYHCPLMSLPHAFGTTLENIPSPRAYLGVSSLHKKYWGKYLGKKTKPRVGVVWQGNPQHPRDCHRSLPLADLITELTENIEWFSLQFEIAKEEEDLISKEKIMTHFGTKLGNFEHSAGLIENLDAVLSVDTSMAHSAAAIGKPVYLLLGNVADARWLCDMSSSPWYSTMKIFNKEDSQNWCDVIKKAITHIQTQEM